MFVNCPLSEIDTVIRFLEHFFVWPSIKTEDNIWLNESYLGLICRELPRNLLDSQLLSRQKWYCCGTKAPSVDYPSQQHLEILVWKVKKKMQVKKLQQEESISHINNNNNNILHSSYNMWTRNYPKDSITIVLSKKGNDALHSADTFSLQLQW